MVPYIKVVIDKFVNASENETVAAVLAVLLATFFARREYIRQKNIDRARDVKNDITNAVLTVQTKMQSAIIVVDRIAYSWSITKHDEREFLEHVIQTEIHQLSKLINEEIPVDLQKLRSIKDIYFTGPSIEPGLKEAYDVWEKELKCIHDVFVRMKIDLKTRVQEQEKLSLVEFNKLSRKLVAEFWRVPNHLLPAD